jgi:hypothetical protein
MNYCRRCVLAAAAVAPLLPAATAARSAPGLIVVDRADGPVACDAFRRHNFGSWTVLRPTTVVSGGVAMRLGPNQTFVPNQTVAGVEVTAVLDRNCGNR